MAFRVAFYTLGCKLNQLETESLADAFARAGATVLPFIEGSAGDMPAIDLVIVNSCTVTSKAEQKARRVVRLALSMRPGAAVIVTGCYAELEAEALSALGDRVIVLPGSRKGWLLDLAPRLIAAFGDEGTGSGGLNMTGLLGAEILRLERDDAFRGAGDATDGRFVFNPVAFAFHARPALKIQDGCDNECAYCRVHIARGPAVSLASDRVLARARALEEAGRSEIVLAGVNLSQYRDGEIDFPALLRILLRGTERIAFRISSYEPDRLDESFRELFAEPRVRPHLHLALQSGSDSVLAAMGRRYTGDGVLESIEKLRLVRRDPFIAADMIAGFPGETEMDARESLELASQIDFAWIHAFRFSPRPGTKAATMPKPVPERIAGERVDALLAQARAGHARYLQKWCGTLLPAVLEKDERATTENYLRVKVAALPSSSIPGQGILCRIEERIPHSMETEEGIDLRAIFVERLQSVNY